MELGLAWTLALVSAYLVGSTPPELPPEYREHGMTDDELYQQISSPGNPLGDMTFAQAVNTDPRRIEGLLLQRIIQPFTLATAKLEHPNLNTDAIAAAMEHAYLERNHRLRSDGRPIDAVKIAEANRRAWKMNSEVMRVAFEMSTPEATVLKELMAANYHDIQRAFRESRQIACQASSVATTPVCKDAWAQMDAVLSNMDDLVSRYVSSLAAEVIDEDLGLGAPSLEQTGATDGADLFGALSFDEAMGAYEFEEHILTGHRAPVIGLAQYRRMGGRVYGGS